jgi:hypothetical protein
MTNHVLCLPLLLILGACGTNLSSPADHGGTGGGSGQQSGPSSTGGSTPDSSKSECLAPYPGRNCLMGPHDCISTYWCMGGAWFSGADCRQDIPLCPGFEGDGGQDSAGGGNSGSIVTFEDGKGKGAMTGYGWVAVGGQATVSDPSCGYLPITQSTHCLTATIWNRPDALCITAEIPASPATSSPLDSGNSWGVQVGVNATNEEPVGTLGSSASGFASATFDLTGSPRSNLRALLHVQGDPEDTFYCADIVSGVAVPLTAFNTACWNGSGVSLVADKLHGIDKVAVQVSSGRAAITVSNLCLTRITFGPLDGADGGPS